MTEPPSPARQMGARLAVARRHGLPFDQAWASALARIDWGDVGQAEVDWRLAIAGTKDAWKAAYERRPSAASEAASRLRDDAVVAA